MGVWILYVLLKLPGVFVKILLDLRYTNCIFGPFKKNVSGTDDFSIHISSLFEKYQKKKKKTKLFFNSNS